MILFFFFFFSKVSPDLFELLSDVWSDSVLKRAFLSRAYFLFNSRSHQKEEECHENLIEEARQCIIVYNRGGYRWDRIARERERESNSIFSFVEETKTRLILSRQMDNSTRGYSPCLSQKIGSVYRGGVENLSIEFSINRYEVDSWEYSNAWSNYGIILFRCTLFVTSVPREERCLHVC